MLARAHSHLRALASVRRALFSASSAGQEITPEVVKRHVDHLPDEGKSCAIRVVIQRTKWLRLCGDSRVWLLDTWDVNNSQTCQ